MKKLALAFLLFATCAQAQQLSGGSGGGGSSGLTVGTTTITGGTTTRILYDNAGVLGEYTLTGTGTVSVMQTSPTFLGTVIIPTPFTLGAVSVTSTGTQLNYLTAATGTTGTTSTNVVFSTSPTLVTPALGVATATSLAVNGATIGADAIAVTGTAKISTSLAIAGATIGSNALAVTGQIAATTHVIASSAGGFQNTGLLGFGMVIGAVNPALLAGEQIIGYFSGNKVYQHQLGTSQMFNSTTFTGWAATATTSTTPDTTLSRNAAGIIQFGTTAANTSGSWLATNGTLSGTLDTTGTVRTSHGYTVATLPAAGTAGRRAYVTDQLTTCAGVGVALTGGGAVVCPAFDNGVAWVGG